MDPYNFNHVESFMHRNFSQNLSPEYKALLQYSLEVFKINKYTVDHLQSESKIAVNTCLEYFWNTLVNDVRFSMCK